MRFFSSLYSLVIDTASSISTIGVAFYATDFYS